MKIFNVTDTPAFLKQVLSCTGNVYCKDDDGGLRDLKQAAEHLAQCSWFSRPERLDEIDIVVEHPTDSQRFFQYMMEARCSIIGRQ